jgi:hypothetical protein
MEEKAKKKEEMKKTQVASPARRRTQSTPSASSAPKAKAGPKKAKKTVNKHQKSKGKKKLTGVELKKKLHSATTLHFITS